MSFISIAYSQYCPTTNIQSKCQTIKYFIYYQFINHNSQSNTLAKIIYKSQLISHFRNSDSPTHQLPKKNSETNRDSQAPNTITYSNSIHSHPLPKKKKKKTQSINHKIRTQTLYQCYVRFWSLKREKQLERADWNFGIEAGGCSCRRQWWVGQIKLLEALRAVVVMWVCGSWG